MNSSPLLLVGVVLGVAYVAMIIFLTHEWTTTFVFLGFYLLVFTIFFASTLALDVAVEIEPDQSPPSSMEEEQDLESQYYRHTSISSPPVQRRRPPII